MRDVANGALDVIWNPIDEVLPVFVHDFQQSFIDFLRRDVSTVCNARREVFSRSWVASAHHITRRKALRGQVADIDLTIICDQA